MSRTLPPPWLTDWPRGVRTHVRTLEYYRALARERARQHRLAIYTYEHNPELFRLWPAGGWNGRVTAGVGREPPDYELDYSHQLQHDDPSPDEPWVPPGLLWSAARVWLCSVAVLALVVALRRLFLRGLKFEMMSLQLQLQGYGHGTPAEERACARRIRRLRGEADNDTVIVPGLENAEPLPADLSETVSMDPPPPYAACSPGGPEPTSSFTHNETVNLCDEEPPPPYSDTYVEFSNKDGIPTVLIFSHKRTPLVNRREIIGSGDVAGDEETAEQNTENTNTEIANEAARNAESDDLVRRHSHDVYDNTGNPSASSSDTVVENDESEYTHKDTLVVV